MCTTLSIHGPRLDLDHRANHAANRLSLRVERRGIAISPSSWRPGRRRGANYQHNHAACHNTRALGCRHTVGLHCWASASQQELLLLSSISASLAPRQREKIGQTDIDAGCKPESAGRGKRGGGRIGGEGPPCRPQAPCRGGCVSARRPCRPARARPARSLPHVSHARPFKKFGPNRLRIAIFPAGDRCRPTRMVPCVLDHRGLGSMRVSWSSTSYMCNTFKVHDGEVPPGGPDAEELRGRPCPHSFAGHRTADQLTVLILNGY